MSENEVTIQVINNYLNNYLNKTPESTEINKSPTLTSTEHAFTLTFDSTQCPTLTLDFDDAEQFSINCVSAKNAHLVRVFTVRSTNFGSKTDFKAETSISNPITSGVS